MELSLNDDIIARCRVLSEQLVEEGVEVMKHEVPVKSGDLQRSIKKEPLSDHSWFIGTDNEYAYYVEHGRGPVFPKGPPEGKKALYWPDLSHPVAKAGPARANLFVQRTVAHIDGRDLN